MKLDKSKLIAMASLSDSQLWSEIRAMAANHGVDMPEKQPSKYELDKVRSALMDAEKLSLISAARLVNDLKKGGK